MSRPPNGYRSGSNPNNTQMSRAERFEDEKRRIIESCFSKNDANGQLAESYITHIRIQEDAQHPSSPAPPDSDPANKKPRLIIVAVRSTGRVRMHKARENNNGSFSIGKTWNLEELSSIETFSGNGMPPPATEREAQYRDWAGPIGFTVTITKPYYWQAGTAKEKDFFIASCVKIYRKYTKGLVPELRGFGEQEKAMILGQPPPSQQPAPVQDQRRPSGGSPAPAPVATQLNQPRLPFAQDGSRSREGSRNREPPAPPSYMNAERQASASPGPPPLRSPRGPPSAGFGQPLGAPRPFASSDHMRSGSVTRESTPGSLHPSTTPAPPPTRQGPSEQSSHSQLRQSSPGRSSQTPPEPSATTGREAVSSGQLRGYQREKVVDPFQESSAAPGFDPSVSSPATAGAFHSAMFGKTRQRSFQSQSPPPQQQQQQQQQQQSMASQDQRWQPEQTSATGAPLLPPILTDQPKIETHSPVTANTAKESEASSAGIDLSDAAAVSALTGFWGPEHQVPTPQFPTPQFTPKREEPPRIAEPASPPTPERSKRRPPFNESRSTDSVDLRPPPLGAATRSRTPNDDASRYTTPQDGRSGIPSPQNIATPSLEEPPATRPQPLFGRQASDKSASDLHLPGAFASPITLSPSGTPREEVVKTLSPQKRPQSPQENVRTAPPSVQAVKLGESLDDATPSEQEQILSAPEAETPEEQYRPGLGPMIKKKAAADRFRSAARAANAFKPRPGGVAEKILQAKAERGANGEPAADGITGVFKPPPKVEEVQKSPEESTPEVRKQQRLSPPLDLSVKPPERTAPPKVEISSPTSPRKGRDDALAALHGASRDGLQLEGEADGLQMEAHSDLSDSEHVRLEQRELREPQAKIKRRSFQQEQYISELGIDRSQLEGKGLDFELLLTDFGWSLSSQKPKQIGELEADIKREVGRVEAGAWLSHTDSAREERVAQVERLLDKAIAECDELEGLLTLYSVELGSLNEDVAYIEAQSQGLQVQSANQKLLHTELQSLVDTTSLDRRTLEPLRYSDLTDERSIETVEGSLVKLYQAMVTIDPNIRSGFSNDGRPRSRGGIDADTELSRMKALREKRDLYDRECTQFCQRLMQQLDYTFTTVLNNGKDRVFRPMSGGPAAPLSTSQKRLDKQAFGSMRSGLWVYSPLILFSKEVNLPAWQTMLRLYYQPAHSLYDSTFKENIASLRRSARKPTGEEGDILFTAQEREAGDAGSGSALSSTARKMTVKRSQTLAKGLRQASGDKRSAAERLSVATLPCEVFASAIDEMAPLISQEQNFVVDLFHATSLETADFMDVVSAYAPHERRGTNLLLGRHVEPDRDMARRITNTMEEIFGFFATETGSLLEWALTGDPIQGVGVMASLSKHSYYLQAQNQSQEWLISMIEAHSARLQTLFSKFIEEQVHAIEDTKVKIKKRKGVIAFMKIFPLFSAAVENTFSTVAGHDYEVNHDCISEVRRLVDDAYNRINRAMFDSLKVIAKESPLQHAPGAQKPIGQSDDPEDKEMLNYQILIIENMNHYLEEVDDGGHGGVLAEWKGRADRERKEAMDAYISRVIRRPLGKLLDYLDATDGFLTNSRGGEAPLAQRQNYSRKAARHLLSQYDGKEVRRGIETLRRRIEKHFGDADEGNISRELVSLVCRESEAAYENTLQRVERLIRDVYPPMEGEKAVEIDFNKSDIQAGFRK